MNTLKSIRKPRQAGRPRRAVALLLVLVTMGTATTLTLGWLASQDNAIPVSRNVARTAQARAVASSGLELAVAIMQTDTPWRTSHDGGLLLENHPIGQGHVDVLITDVATEQPPAAGADTIHVSVTARVENLVQKVEAIASVSSTEETDSSDLSGFAVWVNSGMRLQGRSMIGRWESAPMTSLGRRVFIGTDSVDPRSIDIGPRVTTVDWTLVHDEDASHSLIRNESEMRIRRRSATGTFGPEPTAAVLPSSTGTANRAGSFNPRLEDWEEHPASLRLTTGSTVDLPQDSSIVLDALELENGTTLRITGNTSLTVRNVLEIDNASIMLAPGARLNLICGGEMTLRNAYLGDEQSEAPDARTSPSWYDASRLVIASAETAQTSEPWQIGGSSLVKAVVEAPDARLVIRDDATLAGRLAVDHLRTRHNARILYDHGLDSGSGATKLTAEKMDLRSRINHKLAQRFQRWARDLGIFQEASATTSPPSSTSRYGIAADADWSSDPSTREVDVDVQLLIHGGDTQTWEDAASTLQASANP